MTDTVSNRPGLNLAETIEDVGITLSRTAKMIGVPPMRIHEKVDGRRRTTVISARSGQCSPSEFRWRF